MKSAWIQSFTDDPAKVELRHVDLPTPGAGQVLVRMRMAPVNPSDFNYIEGTYQSAFARLIWNQGVDRPSDRRGNPPFPWPPYDVVRSRVGAERLRKSGSEYVVALEDEGLVGAVHRIAPGGVSFVLDCVGGPTGSDALRCLQPGGRMVCYGTLSRQPLSLPPRDLMMPMTSIEGFYLPAFLADRSLLQRLGLVRKTAKLIQQGVLDTPVEQTYRLDALHQALDHARRPGRMGKVLFDMIP